MFKLPLNAILSCFIFASTLQGQTKVAARAPVSMHTVQEERPVSNIKQLHDFFKSVTASDFSDATLYAEFKEIKSSAEKTYLLNTTPKVATATIASTSILGAGISIALAKFKPFIRSWVIGAAALGAVAIWSVTAAHLFCDDLETLITRYNSLKPLRPIKHVTRADIGRISRIFR